MGIRSFGLLMALLVVAMTTGPLAQTQAQSTARPVVIPGQGDGYDVKPTNGSQPAPPGFEGRTDTSTVTAVGNTPATRGKTVVARLTLGNQVRTCPQADGKAEGEGVFSITVDSTDAQAGGTSTTHIEMRAKATYKGQVADDAYLEGPVNAEIEYTYTQTGTIRGTGGALLTPAVSQIEQRITIPFVAGRNLTAPDIGAFAGGDPTNGHYSDAIITGHALVHWAGIYYSIAQTKWREGRCVEISFSPPSNTVQPALGTQARVKAEVKTKRGEIVKAQFLNARAYSGGSVSPPGGGSDVGLPLTFTYTAPNQRAPNTGFAVGATSRAGVADASWTTSLGTGWSGQISCTNTHAGDEGTTEQQSWSNFSVSRLTINLTNGVGEATGYSELKNMARSLRPAVRDGAVVLLFDRSSSMDGVVDGVKKASVNVTVGTDGTYSIQPEFLPFDPGTQRSTTCGREGCQVRDQPFHGLPCLPAGSLSGRFTNPNELHGSMSDVKTGLGRRFTGTHRVEVTWDLARQGTTR